MNTGILIIRKVPRFRCSFLSNLGGVHSVFIISTNFREIGYSFDFFLATLKFGSARDLGMFPEEKAVRMPVLTQKCDSECFNFHRLIKQKDYFLESSARVPVNTETHERPKLYNVA